MFWFNLKPSKPKTKADLTIMAPVSGALVPLEEVPDVVFAEKIVGEGIAIQPTQGRIVAPCSCIIQEIFETNHAIVLNATPKNLIIFIHIGINTVELKKEKIFNRLVEEGDSVHAGDPLLSFDLDLLQKKATSTITPIVISASCRKLIKSIQKKQSGNCTAGETPILEVFLNHEENKNNDL